MNSQLKISIITPTYNSGEYLEHCIQSIMNQRYHNYEHIIIDGGSTDDTINIIKRYEHKYPMKWISEKDDGMYDALTKGFSMASGDIYAWINSDDFYYPWTLFVVAKVFAKREIQWLTGIPSSTQVFENVELSYLMPNLPPVYCTSLIKKGLYNGNSLSFVQQESCFWSKTLWKMSGGIEKKYKYAGDYFLWKKFAEYAKLYTVHCSLASFRIHENQKSGDRNAYAEEMGNNKAVAYSTLLQIYIHLYSIMNYRKYVINLNSLFDTDKKL